MSNGAGLDDAGLRSRRRNHALAVKGICGEEETTFEKSGARREARELQSAPGKWSEEAREGEVSTSAWAGVRSAGANQVAARTGRRLVLRVLRKGRRAFRRLVCEGLQSVFEGGRRTSRSFSGDAGSPKKKESVLRGGRILGTSLQRCTGRRRRAP